MAATGMQNKEIAARLSLPVQIVFKWRKRFLRNACRVFRSVLGEADRRSFPPEVVVSCKALACALPATLGVPLARLHMPDLKAEMIARGIVAEISDMTIWRWLSEDAIRPWRHRSWIFPRDPDFEAKAAPVLDLYARRWRRKPLGTRDFVISADEKTSIQARVRCHPTAAPAPDRDMRVEHEYDRGGSLAYLAAWDVHRARVFGRCEPKAGIEPFDRLVEQVMTTQPYASARRVFWVVDNGSSHRGQKSIDRSRAARTTSCSSTSPSTPAGSTRSRSTFRWYSARG